MAAAILGTSFLLLVISMIIYIIIKSNRILKNKISNKYIRILLIVLIFVLIGIGLKIDFVNALIVDLHIYVFLLLSEFLIFIIKKVRKKDIKNYISVIIALIISTIYLSNAYYLAHHVVKTNYVVNQTKNININNFRIAQLSDSHIGVTMNGDDFIKYMEKINNEKPDLVLVTGDFVDDDTSYKDMIKGCKGLGNLKAKYGVYFILGNHDKGYFNNRDYDFEDVREELNKNDVLVLEDSSVQINDDIILVGRQDSEVSDRKSSKELTNNLDESKYIIMLDHQPNDFKNESNSNVDLVLLGHTHGGQLFPIGPISEALNINDSTYGLSKIKNKTFIVNSGLSDWAIKFKSFTKAEFGIIDIKSK